MDAYEYYQRIGFMDEKLDKLLDTISTMSKQIDILTDDNRKLMNEKFISDLLNMSLRTDNLSDADLARIDSDFEKAYGICRNREKREFLAFKHQYFIREILDRNCQ